MSLGIGFLALLANFQALGNPTGGTVSLGSATFSSSASQFTINQTSANAFINWATFNIGAGETTTFNQPTASSVTWNQIGDANASQILGNLNANGFVVLQNPNGFNIGGQAVITAQNLVMTTASTPPIDFTSGNGSPWSFSTPPPTASIINYGKINIIGGGSAFLIAADTENKQGGTISAPGGNIGLYDGETVLVSTSPDGRGLSAAVTLPQGSVDNEGHLIADLGSIVVQAQMVNQNGLVQANSVKDVNGTIELVASGNLTLGASSVISAQGDPTATTPSSGGSVQLQSGNSFSDQSGSVINVSGGAYGGSGGQISISAPVMTALNSTLNGQATAGYAGGSLSINTTDIEDPLLVNINSVSPGFSQINLQASDDIELSSDMTMTPESGISDSLSLMAGNTITLDAGSEIEVDGGKISLSAPTVTLDGTLQANSIGSANGTIEIDAGDSLNLGANSVISAQGDPTTPSSGGSVQLDSGNSFSDLSGSLINVSGSTQGGNGGQISISAPGMTALNSSLNGQAVAGYAGGTLSINTEDIEGTLAQDVAQAVNASSSGFSQINLQAADDIELSSQLTLTPESGIFGTVSLVAGNTITLDAGSEIEADAGRISLNAPTVVQDGTLQANSIGSDNGAVEIDAGQSLSLDANSVISAQGDTGDSSASPGGFVVLYAANSFSDTAGSTISVAGNATGGRGGIVEIFDPQAGSTPMQTTVSGAFANFINPDFLTLSEDEPTSPSSQNLYTGDLQNYSEICLYNIELASTWSLGDASAPATLNLSAMNNIIVDDGSGISAGDNWNVNLTAGTSLPFDFQPVSGSDGIYLDGGATIQAENGNINLWAANEVQVGWSGANVGIGAVNPGAGDITTGYDPDTFSFISEGGGNISVMALFGDVNTGSSLNGFDFNKNAPFTTVDPSLGGISTGAGGNVNISAGGDVISYLPTSSDYASTPNTFDPGTGAFGPGDSGNVTINAGGSVYGHYVLADGIGTITAGVDVGQIPNSSIGSAFALGLIDGTWNVNAPNGSIYLQEVRNPNGVFNSIKKSASNLAGYHLFNYGADATVNLSAGIGVELTANDENGVTPTDPNYPRLSDFSAAIPVLYPPILNITAGSGGVTLDGDVTLFPSPDQNLSITTTDGGSLSGTFVNGSSTPSQLLMSDSADTRFTAALNFDDGDHGGLSFEPVASDSDPVDINISGDMENLELITTKATQITVGQDMMGCSFFGQNLNSSDITSITVAGQIFNQSPYTFEYGVDIPNTPIGDLPTGVNDSWDDIFLLALNSTAIDDLQVPSLNLVPLSEWANYALYNASLFGTGLSTSGNYGSSLINPNPGLTYNPTTGQLGFAGPMPANFENELTKNTITITPPSGPEITLIQFTVLALNDGVPETYVKNGETYFTTTTLNWIDPSVITTLYNESQGTPSATGASQLGYIVGGPGTFDVDAGSIELGNTEGILSEGADDYESGLDRYQNLASVTPSGATVNVTVSGELQMLSSTIAALGGGDVNVTSTGGSMDLGSQDLGSPGQRFALGIYTAGIGDVNVIALGDIDIDGSRIASFNGGNIFVESEEGNVDVGSGGDTLSDVYYDYIIPGVNPGTEQADIYQEAIFGNGIVADTLASGANAANYPPAGVPVGTAPGNITVVTPQGDITSTLGGILQQALNGNFPSGPTVSLSAGTPYDSDWSSTEPALYIGNIDLGNAGVIGGTVNVQATGNFSGLIFARQNTTVQVVQGFSGTVLAGGSADVSASTVSGTIAGIGGVNVSGNSSSALLLGQNVSVNGGSSQSTLGSSATATASSTSASGEASSQSQQQVTSNQTGQDDNKKKKPQIRKVGRVTVILSAAVPQ